MEPLLIKKNHQSNIINAKRIVVKIGSTLLVNEQTGTIRYQWLEKLADDIASLKKQGKDLLKP